jgi:peptidoglycan/LPS O-acetylase OafA/YrhL
VQRKIPQLDGVRGVAILLVLAHNLHAFYTLPLSLLTSYGWMGVDLFFVLSGFLITGILLDSKSSPAYFRNFYARRCLRIWPLYYAVLLLMFVVVPLLRPQDALEIFRRAHPWWSYPFFLQNFFVPDPVSAPGPLGVSWSLAVEELFYLVWPFFVRFVPMRRLETGAWTVCLLSPLLRLSFVNHGWLIYSNPFCRLDGLMAGGLLAILVRKSDFRAARHLRPAWVSFLLGGVLAIVSELYGQRWLTFSLAVFASAGFVYLAQFSEWTWVKTAVTNRFLMFSGTISYGLYILHKLPVDVLKSQGFPTLHPRTAFWISLVAAYLVASASWFFLEKPLLRLKRLFETRDTQQDTSPVSLSPLRPPETT